MLRALRLMKTALFSRESVYSMLVIRRRR